MTPFEKILAGELPAEVVYEDDDALAFLDANPVADGHALVIPKRAAKTLFDITPSDLDAVMRAAKKVAETLKQRYGCAGVNILHASDAAAQQSVPYFHVHVVPRYADDGLDLWLN